MPERADLLRPEQRAALGGMLRAHRCRDRKERADRDRIVAFVERHADAHLRSNREGHLTGSAFVIERGRGRVLLTHHRRLGRWLQLGGHGEGEWDPAAVALREAEEESGLAELRFHPACRPTAGARVLAAPFDLDIHEIPASRGEPAHLHLDVRYVLVSPDERPQVVARADESLALRWFAIDEALRLPGLDASLRRALTALAELPPAPVQP